MDFKIRDASQNDMEAVLMLIQELADFEKESDAVEISAKQLIQDGFIKNPPLFKCFVAEIDEIVVGAALVYTRYSTWKGQILHLEDLIVTSDQRGQGIGSALLDTVVQFGHNLGVKRINWEVLDWNSGAIKLYEQKGAKVLRDWNVVHLGEKGIKAYIKTMTSASI